VAKGTRKFPRKDSQYVQVAKKKNKKEKKQKQKQKKPRYPVFGWLIGTGCYKKEWSHSTYVDLGWVAK